MFQVKICGITNLDDAQAAAEAGADAIGLNFFTGSDRYVAPAIAREIVPFVPKGVLRVGVFVNAHERDVRHVMETVTLDAVQLHGDWSGSAVSWIEGVPTIVAFRLAPGRLDEVTTWLKEARERGHTPDAILVDAFHPGVYGGTGRQAPWEELVGWQERWPGINLVLAGGLTSDNVAEAIALVRPSAVDVASGVEASPGVKDPKKVRQFVANARAALGA